MISRQPAAKNTITMSSFIRPVVSPFGENSSRSTPRTPTSCRAQTIQQAKKIRAMASVMFKSALDPRNSG